MKYIDGREFPRCIRPEHTYRPPARLWLALAFCNPLPSPLATCCRAGTLWAQGTSIRNCQRAGIPATPTLLPPNTVDFGGRCRLRKATEPAAAPKHLFHRSSAAYFAAAKRVVANAAARVKLSCVGGMEAPTVLDARHLLLLTRMLSCGLNGWPVPTRRGFTLRAVLNLSTEAYIEHFYAVLGSRSDLCAPPLCPHGLYVSTYILLCSLPIVHWLCTSKIVSPAHLPVCQLRQPQPHQHLLPPPPPLGQTHRRPGGEDKPAQEALHQ